MRINDALLNFLGRHCTAAEDIVLHGYNESSKGILDQLFQIRSLRRLSNSHQATQVLKRDQKRSFVQRLASTELTTGYSIHKQLRKVPSGKKELI